MRLIALLATTLVAVPAWSQHRAPPARDPMPPPLLFNAEQCHSQLDPGAKRSRCIECVRQGGKFHTQGRGRGFCENAPPQPPPPPPAAVLDSPPQCNTLAHPPKRARCMECVTHGGRFFTQGPGHGFCKNAPPPPPPPPPPAVLDSPPQCNELAHPRKRARCLECVTHGGRFFTQGPGHDGFCKNAPPPPPPPALPPVLVEPGQCDGLVRPPKRARCVECVTHGGQFFTQGGGHGYCKTPPPPPPPSPEIPVLRSVPECNEHVQHPGKRARCRHCVMNGGSFHRAGPGQCVHAPPPPPPEVITSIPECNHRLGPKHMRKACHRCLKQGGRYHLNGACRF